MNPLASLSFFREFLFSGPEVVAAFFVGVALSAVVGWLVQLWLVRTRPAPEVMELESQLRAKDHELDRERAAVTTLTRLLHERDARQQLEEKVAQLSQACEQEREGRAELARANDELRARVAALKGREGQIVREAKQHMLRYRRRAEESQRQADALSGQIQEVTNLQGKVWEKPVAGPVPPFRPLGERAAPVVAVANLKGGVGKTSLTANLAATFWRGGRRVLVVDLDNQASLTHLCLPPEKVQSLRADGGRYVRNVLRATAEHGLAAWKNRAPVNADGFCLLAASEELADVEEHIKAGWLLNPGGPDPRYVLRAALHDAHIQDHFDLILIDCPPRLGTACVNALAACDGVLIPVLPDRTSADAVPRLLEWLRHLKKKQVCPDLDVLGVVANRTQRRASLIRREEALWQQLAIRCRDAWGADVYHCERFIPTSAQFAEAANDYEFAADRPELQAIFEELTTELAPRFWRTADHAESSRPATVH